MLDEKGLLKIIYAELGETSYKLFYDFHHGEPIDKQIESARDLLSVTIGDNRTNEILKISPTIPERP